MLTENYYRLYEMIYKGDESGNSTTFINSYGQSKTLRLNRNNAISYVDSMNFKSIGSTAHESSGSSGIMFGDDATPPTPADYKLSGNVIANLTLTHSVARVMKSDGCAEITNTVLVTNGNTNDVTIKEVGLFTQITAYNPTSSSGLSSYTMVDRTVLDTPVTIPAGGIGQVTYTIRMNYPTV